MSGVINCAHRGASGLAPENTLVALDLAVSLGATMAEIDIQQTADDRLVLFHDDDLDRTSTGTGPLWQKNLDQLKTLDAGSWFSGEFSGETIPTLEEAVALARGRLKLNIELKMHGHERGLENLVSGALRDLACLDWCLVTSFDHGAINRMMDIAPEVKTGYIVGRVGWDDSLLAAGVSVLSLEKSLVTSDRVHGIHSEGKEIHVWTVNEVEEMSRLQSLGVDVIISNHPDRLVTVTKQR
jgi:glycerophosphoryl diester phosphodiesterase